MNKKVPGMFKDECGGKIIAEFCGLRAKCYAFKLDEDGSEKKRCKGVKKCVVDKSTHLEDYKKCLFTGKDDLRKQNLIRSRSQNFTLRQSTRLQCRVLMTSELYLRITLIRLLPGTGGQATVDD